MDDNVCWYSCAAGVATKGRRLVPAPLLCGVGGRRTYKYSSCANVNERQHKEFTYSRQSDDLVGKEVSLKQRFRMHGDELMPRRFASIGSRLEAVVAHDIDDELARAFASSQLAQFSMHSCTTPARLSGNHNDEVAKRDERRATALNRSAIPLASRTQRAKVRGETMEISSRIAEPSGLPNLSSRCRSRASSETRLAAWSARV